jgi:hypothetical protein
MTGINSMRINRLKLSIFAPFALANSELIRYNKTGRPEDRKTGRPEDRKTGRLFFSQRKFFAPPSVCGAAL